jgi:hypothetical protein
MGKGTVEANGLAGESIEMRSAGAGVAVATQVRPHVIDNDPNQMRP